MTLKVDQEKCIGCGVCESICPECFKLDDSNKAQVVCAEPDQYRCKINEAAGACPEGAILVA